MSLGTDKRRPGFGIRLSCRSDALPFISATLMNVPHARRIVLAVSCERIRHRLAGQAIKGKQEAKEGVVVYLQKEGGSICKMMALLCFHGQL